MTQRYVIKFEAWTGGHFVCNFINNHASFPGIKSMLDRYKHGQKHHRCPYPFDLNTDRYDEIDDIAVNKNYSKVAVIPSPHANEYFANETTFTPLHPTDKIIILTYSNNLHPVLHDRLCVGTKNDTELPDVQMRMRDLLKRYNDAYECLLLNSNEIIQYNDAEYEKLCSFLDETPNENWHNMIDYYWKDILGTTYN